jgi:hypothetical protein
MTPQQVELVAKDFAEAHARAMEFAEALAAHMAVPAVGNGFSASEVKPQHIKFLELLGEFIRVNRRFRYFLPVTRHGLQVVPPGLDALKEWSQGQDAHAGLFQQMSSAFEAVLPKFLKNGCNPEQVSAWRAAFAIIGPAVSHLTMPSPQPQVFQAPLPAKETVKSADGNKPQTAASIPASLLALTSRANPALQLAENSGSNGGTEEVTPTLDDFFRKLPQQRPGMPRFK